MHFLYAFIALDIADARAREAQEHNRYLAARQERPSALRRGLAHGLAAISLGTAAATRRLDDVVADDLGRALLAGE